MLGRSWRLLAAGLVLLGATTTAHAQDWPKGPVRLVIPFPAAGTTDLLGRAYAEALRGVINETVIVENKSGAGGNVGAAVVAQAAGDGQTILMTTPGILSINRWLYKTLGYDPDKDFKTVALVGLVPSGIAINPRVQASNLQELVAVIKGRTDFRNATPGVGTTGHLMSELMKSEAQVTAIHVPYRGNAPALQALLGGEVDMLIDGIPAMVPHHEKGAIKILAVTSPTRQKNLPNVPTVAELGFPHLAGQAWYGIVAPAGTPDAIVDKIHAASTKAMQDTKLLERFATIGIEPQTSTPADMAKLAREEAVRWKSVVEKSGAKLE